MVSVPGLDSGHGMISRLYFPSSDNFKILYIFLSQGSGVLCTIIQGGQVGWNWSQSNRWDPEMGFKFGCGDLYS